MLIIAQLINEVNLSIWKRIVTKHISFYNSLIAIIERKIFFSFLNIWNNWPNRNIGFSILSDKHWCQNWELLLPSFNQLFFNNESIYCHCSNDLFQLLKNKNWSQFVGNLENQHWTCLVCSDKSIVSSAEIQYCSSISVSTRGPIINEHYY